MIPFDHPLVQRIKGFFSDRNLLRLERAFGIFGICLTFWMIYRLGPSRVASDLHRVSWGFFVLVLFKGMETALETCAWKGIIPPGGNKIGFWEAFKTILEGNALNYITMTRMGGEPLKAFAFKDRIGLARSTASVIILKFCVLTGFWITIAGGFIAVLFRADIPSGVKIRVGLGVLLVTLFLASASWMQSVGLFKPISWVLKKFEAQKDWMKENLLGITHMDDHLLETYRSRPFRVGFAILLCTLVWVEEIFFIWLGLRFLHLDQDWYSAAIVGTLALLLNHLLFFVPWRAGTQEGTMVLAFTIGDLSEPVGLSVAILKRLRELLWVFLGLIFFALETLKAPDSEAPPSS